MFTFVLSSVRSLLGFRPGLLVGTNMQELMHKDSRLEFNNVVEKARRGLVVA